MQNIKLPRRKEWGERAVCYRLFFFNISFSFSCLPSPPDLHHFSETSLDGISFSGCLSPAFHYFLTVPERVWAGGGGEKDVAAPRVSQIFSGCPKAGRGVRVRWEGGEWGAMKIMLNVINLPDSRKSDMHELRRNLFLFRHETLLHNEEENVLCALINSDRSCVPKYFYLWHYLFFP